jgi:hypothetical protein
MRATTMRASIATVAAVLAGASMTAQAVTATAAAANMPVSCSGGPNN